MVREGVYNYINEVPQGVITGGGINLFSNLEAEMARYKLSRGMLAEIVGMSSKTLCNKMNGKTGFTLKEMRSIQAAMPNGNGLTLDYLFEVSGRAS